MLNAMTVDVEDYFHVTAFASTVRIEDWDQFQCRVEANTYRILEMLAAANTRATFFVLGWVAHKYPRLVREIHGCGHEIGNHSYWHRLVYNLTPEEFRKDLLLANKTIENIIGQAVVAYRAPSFSITQRSLWALEILAEEGFQYDSSIFPIRHDRYGIAGAPRGPHPMHTAEGHLREFPPSVLRVAKFNVPVGGGGYFRLYPTWFTRYCLRRINAQNRPVMFYIHPWEFDINQPRLAASRTSRFRHYINLAKTESRFERLLTTLRFSSMSDSDRAFQRMSVDDTHSPHVPTSGHPLKAGATP
jgi:polysaccharide deacetylase family protein (PEP-CTERM system associated)